MSLLKKVFNGFFKIVLKTISMVCFFAQQEAQRKLPKTVLNKLTQLIYLQYFNWNTKNVFKYCVCPTVAGIHACVTDSDCADVSCGHGEYVVCETLHGSGVGTGEGVCKCVHHKRQGTNCSLYTMLLHRLRVGFFLLSSVTLRLPLIYCFIYLYNSCLYHIN